MSSQQQRINKKLRIAIDNNQLEEVKHLVEESGADINAEYSRAIHAASWVGNCEMIEYLIQMGASVNSRASGNGWTPLINAAANGKYDAVKLLLDNGASDQDDCVDKEGKTALQYAKEFNHMEVYDLIRNYKKPSSSERPQVQQDTAKHHQKEQVQHQSSSGHETMSNTQCMSTRDDYDNLDIEELKARLRGIKLILDQNPALATIFKQYV